MHLSPHRTSARLLGVLSVLLLPCIGGCAPEVSTARMSGVYPSRAPTCELELRSGTMDFALTSTFDAVGTVSVRGKDGEAPNAPRILALVKPEACALGGELVLVNTSANLTNGFQTSSHHSFIVMRRKSPGGGGTQKF
jgi:hypothetical protein